MSAKIASQIVEKALKKAQGAQALVQKTESTDVTFENDLLKSTQSSQRTEIAVKVMLNGRLGTSSTTDVSDLDGVVSRAIESAEFGSEAHFRFPGSQAGMPVRVYDSQVLPVTKPDMIQVGQEMIDLIKTCDPAIMVGSSINKRISAVEFANSAGMAFTNEITDFGARVEAQRVRGTDILFIGGSFGWKKRTADHVPTAQKVADWFRLADRMAALPSGSMPVIFAPPAAAVFLLTLYLGLDGKNVLLGASPLARKLGERVADPRFSLIDNPLLDYAPGSAPFDDEGTARQVTPLIEAGVVKHFLYDLDTAGRAGTRPTGHGPNRYPTNLMIEKGAVSYADMLKNIRQGLLVHTMLGLGQGNAINGEFSVNVGLGYAIENGEITGRVKDVMLAGNVYSALNDIAAVGDQAEWVNDLFYGAAPYLQIGSLNVVAH